MWILYARYCALTLVAATSFQRQLRFSSLINSNPTQGVWDLGIAWHSVNRKADSFLGGGSALRTVQVQDTHFLEFEGNEVPWTKGHGSVWLFCPFSS